MPLNLNTFAAEAYPGDPDLVRSLKTFKMHQRRQITSIRLDYYGHGPEDWDTFLDECRAKLERLLPNVNTIEFVIMLLGNTVYQEDIVTRTEAALRQCNSTNTPINVKVKVLDRGSIHQRDLIAWCSDS